jgi:hypothetical protein
MKPKLWWQPMEYDDDGVLRFKENAIVHVGQFAVAAQGVADQLCELLPIFEAWAAAEKEDTKARRAKERQAVRDRRRKRIQQRTRRRG